MSLRQLRLIPSGVQAWYRDTIAASSEYFAYSSTMALYIFRIKNNTMQKMIVAHDAAISSVCWSPQDPNLVVSCAANGKISIRDLETEEERYAIKIEKEVPWLMDWENGTDTIVVATESGAIKFWKPGSQEARHIFQLDKGQSPTVLRWHPRVAGRLLVGTSEGALIIWDTGTQKKVQIVGKVKTSKEPVTDAQWDPLSDDYLLAAFGDGMLTLYDVSTQREIHSFDKQVQGIRCLEWARGQPGNFVTAGERVGLLKLWNVSQKQPLSQIKVTSPVSCMKAIPSQPHWMVMSFKNGAVGIFDLAQRKMRFTSSPGHSETIFDVAFHPLDSDMLATASYDGHVKLWQIATGEIARDMFAGKGQLLYGLAFGPDASCICAVSGVGVLLIWRTDTSEQLLRLQVHTGQAYRVDWKLRAGGGSEIATGGADGTACITDAIGGQLVRKISHPGAVVGVNWHATEDGILATACQDMKIRIFMLPPEYNAPEQLQVILDGHTARVFNVIFHPICPDIVASGSDDKTVRVWNRNPAYHGGREIRSLLGHTANVRALLWHSELPHILFSGSWDYTVRVWDVSESRCLHVAYEHHADVYGLTLHAQRPFFLVSSSRDTTLRYWVFEDLVRPLLVQAIFTPERFAELLGNSGEAVNVLMNTADSSSGAFLSKTKLYGPGSRALWASLQGLLGQGNQAIVEVYRRILTFFMYRHGFDDIWGLISMIRGEPPSTGLSMSSRSVFHERELIACQKSKALELASQKGTVGVAGKLEERLLKAAQIMMRIGDLRSYCRLVAQAGQWERAICIAPAVSKEFWLELCNEYTESLSANTALEEAAPFWVATGRSAKLVDEYIERNELDSAFVVAKADCDMLMPQSDAAAGGATAGAPREAVRAQVEDVAGTLARRYLEQCEPVLAAMCYLAVSNVPRATSTLLASHEVVLAYLVNELLGQPKNPVHLKHLSHCAERAGLISLAADILRHHPQGPQLGLPLLAIRTGDEALLQAVCSEPPENYRQRCNAALADRDSATATLSAVMARDSQQAAEVGVAALYALFSQQGGWSVVEARAILEPMESLPLRNMDVKSIASVLACAAYVGLVEASFLGYQDLLFPLAQTLRNIVIHQSLAFPVHMAEVTLLEATCMSHLVPQHALQLLNQLLMAADTPPHLRQACEAQQSAIASRLPQDEWEPNHPLRLGKLSGGNLPSCCKRFAKTSVLTNALIKGPTFELEDQKLHIALSDAMAWTRVNAFSPLNTGCRIQPF